jgi:hypothetical protein
VPSHKNAKAAFRRPMAARNRARHATGPSPKPLPPKIGSESLHGAGLALDAGDGVTALVLLSFVWTGMKSGVRSFNLG